MRIPCLEPSHYNCPIVTSYAENIKNNVEEIKSENIDFRNPFLSFESEDILAKRLKEVFPDIPAGEIKAAVSDAWKELMQSREDMHKKGEEAFIIPFSVMFRFFPTISEEAGSIGNAMRMRGITGKNFFKNPQAVLEYRIVPLMMSVVTIGNDLSAAALTRGLGNGKKRTSICKIGFHWKDFALMIIVTAALLVFLLF